MLQSLDLSQDCILIEQFLMITSKDYTSLTYSNTHKVNVIVWMALAIFDLNLLEEAESHFIHNQIIQVILD